MASLSETAYGCVQGAQAGSSGAWIGAIVGCLGGGIGADAQINARNDANKQLQTQQQIAALNLLAQREAADAAGQLPGWAWPAGILAIVGLGALVLLQPAKKKAPVAA